VANYQSNTIERLSSDGTRTTFSSGSNLKGPVGLTVDDSGNVYVANYLGGNVARINPAGVSSIVATGFKKPYYVTLDKEGNLYVSQQEDNSIVRIALPRPIGARPQ
jgi:DNA-binding beta-propeller fold protein YncE